MHYLSMLLLLLLPFQVVAQVPEDPHAAVTPVQTQLDAYNAGDLELFLSAYADDVRIYNFPDELRYEGKERMRTTYGPMFADSPDLQCRLISRIVMGNRVLDHESVIFDPEAPPVQVVAMYLVEDGLIREVRFLR
ncbi:nuclear transport factor 2 family protein [Neolewinella litorea]|uniref:Steroid delta-isomerase n=1 Tax=Neolewinella litorea TaxID=2562452 RepID=A0A4S4NNG2_9BACT|nr:nuclear transport factor 2 family protein [Neolewinella litorea]THH40547.1 steroid delta-isomerase [Neolewinella litorea]